MQISVELANARLQAVIDFLAAGAAPATVKFYDGTQPVFGGTATNLLATVELTEPLGTVSNGTLTIAPSPEAMVQNSGVVTWARWENGNGVLAFDCAVTDLAGAGPLKVASTQLYAGGNTRISSGTFA